MKDRRGTGAPGRGAVIGHAAFCLLLAFNVVRTLRHEMWRDELQVFQIAAASQTLADLFDNLRYEPRGALWDLLVWGLTRLTADPFWMQVLHAAIAAAIWLLVYRRGPFTRLETFLLLGSYFLFFEYFVVSRQYALAVLCGFCFAALWRLRPVPAFMPWLLLGLMANLAVHATIWSIAFAAAFALEQRRHDARFLAGAALYLGLLAVAFVGLVPAPDFGPWPAAPAFDPASLNNALATMLGAFVPLDPGWPRAMAAFLAAPHVSSVPFIWDPNPVQRVLQITPPGALHPLRLALLAVPVVLCAVVTRDRWRLLGFSLAYAGIMLFAVLWHFTGSARHHGLVFAAFVASVWAARAHLPRTSSWPLVALLAINALGGVLALGSEFNTFSHGRSAARWIERNAGPLPLVGQRDAQVSSVAGYLGRAVYYLECECRGRFIVWNARRRSPLSADEVRERLDRAFEREGRDVILVRNRPLTDGELPSGATTTLLQSFTGAVTDENYWIYRLTAAAPPQQ